MHKLIFEISSNELVAKDTYRMVLENPASTKMAPGQFVDIALEGKFLRRPISVCESDQGGIVLMYKAVGEGTRQMSQMKSGESLELLTGLGHGFDPDACQKAALLVGGGLGCAPMFNLCRELLASGKKVSVVLGFNTSEEIVLEEKFRQLGAVPALATLDGSRGVKGFVTDAINELKPEYDFFYTCGPLPMMKALCGVLECPGEVSLEQRMGCGAGYCYCCSAQTLKGAKRVCKDGPVFKKEDVIW